MIHRISQKVLIPGISLTEAYSVKVSGKVELGSRLSKVFKDLYQQLVEEDVNPKDPNSDEAGSKIPAMSVGNIENSDSCEDSSSYVDEMKKIKKRKKQKHHNMHESHSAQDKTLKSGLEELHLYGYHKSPNKVDNDRGKPLNNVHI
ncbi:unnamed protein product [Spodoptera exigua]|nr:unnamed protein product [Spodoptera exigua]